MELRPPAAGPRVPLASLLPNALTLGALCAGLTAIRMGFEGRVGLAVGLILLAAALDGLDGRLARRLRSESAMGAELDSLCDFVNFGVAPALVVHLWAFGAEGGSGWIAALVYAVACALRLARFNIGSRESAALEPKRTFTGIPSPAGAVLAMLPIYVAFLMPAWPPLPSALTAAWLVAVGAGMASRLPTPAFRPVDVRPETARLLLLGAVALGAALLTYPWLTLVVASLAYLVLLGASWARLRRRLTRKET